jgi:hypothetical protein
VVYGCTLSVDRTERQFKLRILDRVDDIGIELLDAPNCLYIRLVLSSLAP